MTLRFNLRGSRLLLTAAIFFVCGLAAAPDAVAQKIPKETDREKKSASVRQQRRKQVRQTAPPAAKSADTVVSDKFTDLGDSFRAQQKWKAAEAAYKEAVKVWSRNAEAVLELGYLYLTWGKMDEAQKTYGQLRSINGSYASELLADINRAKSNVNH